MVVEEVVVNASGLIDNIIPVLIERAGPLITIFKAVGIVLIVYVIYLIYGSIVRMKDRRRLKRIDRKVVEIDRKLDRLLMGEDKRKKKKK